MPMMAIRKQVQGIKRYLVEEWCHLLAYRLLIAIHTLNTPTENRRVPEPPILLAKKIKHLKRGETQQVEVYGRAAPSI